MRAIAVALALSSVVTLAESPAHAAGEARKVESSAYNTGHSAGASAVQITRTAGSPGSSSSSRRSGPPAVDHRAEYARLYGEMARRSFAEQAQRAAEHAHYTSLQQTVARCEAAARHYEGLAVRRVPYQVSAGFGRYVTLYRTVYDPAAAAPAAAYARCAEQARAALASYAAQVSARRAAWDAEWAALNRQAHEHWRAFNTSCETLGRTETVATQLCSYDEWRNYSPGNFERDVRLGGPRPPAELIDRARDEVTPLAPVIRMNPRVEWEQVVHLPTWLWLEGPWAPQTARAEAGEAWAQATATPTRVVWDMGNGDSVTCPGPGTPYDEGRPGGGQATDCSYTFSRSSAGEPGDAYTVTATVVYDVAWTGSGGAGGDLGTITTSAAAAVRVAELQALRG